MKTLILYIFVDLLALLFMAIYESMKRKSNNSKKIHKYHFWYVLSILALTSLIGLRNVNVGTDTLGYVDVFYRIVENRITIIDLKWLGTGYVYLLKLIGLIFGKNYIALNSVVGIISIIFLYKGIVQNSQKYTFSLFLFIATTLYYQMFNQSRQLLAISIVLYSFKYLKNRNFKAYTFYTLLASSIHESAIVMLPFYFFTNFKLNKQNFFLYGIIIAGSYFGFTYIERIILSTYYGSLYYGSNFYTSSFSSIIVLAFRVFLMTMLLLTIRKKEAIDESEKMLINFSIFCTLIQILTLKVHILGRISTYFFIFYIISIPNTIETISSKRTKSLYKFILIIVFIVYHFGYYYLNAYGAGYDYYSFFFQ